MIAVKTILFVENDPVALTMYQNRLEREGFRVESAQDGLAALRCLSQATPDLMVLDLMLPKLNGGDVLKYMRADARLKKIPVIIFTNAPITEVARDIALSGTTRYMAKSDSTFSMLLEAIQDTLAAEAAAVESDYQEYQPEEIQSPEISDGSEFTFPPIPTDTPVAADGPINSSSFLNDALAQIPKIREHCFSYIKAPSSSASAQHLPGLHERIQSLSSNSIQAGFARVAQLGATFDALLSEIMAKPSWVTPSMLQTIAQAVDCLESLLTSDESTLSEPVTKSRALAVDDDPVCNHVIVTTLHRADFEAESVSDPLDALRLLQQAAFDLVLLDVSMPGLSGFEVCEKMRQLPHCRTTPVIFVTAHNNFDNRKQSVISGGHDFITKPVSPSELALKATIHVLKGRMQNPASVQLDFAPDAETTLIERTQPIAPPFAPETAPEFAMPDNDVIEEQLIPQDEPAVPVAAMNWQLSSDSLPDPELVPFIVSQPQIEPVEALALVAPSEETEILTAPAAILQTTETGTEPPDEPEVAVPSMASLVQLESPASQEIEAAVEPVVLPLPPIPAAADEPAVPMFALPQPSSETETGTQSAPLAVAPPPPRQDPMQLAPPLISQDTHQSEAPMKTDRNEIFEKIVVEVARIIFGDGNLTELNLRLVRMALERHNIHNLVGIDRQS